MKTLLCIALMLTSSAALAAGHCRNAKGQFAKCGTPGALPETPTYTAPGNAVPAPATSAKKATKRCRDHGKFVKCPQ